MLEPKEPDPLCEARHLYEAQNYEASKKKLQQIKQTNESIELNALLTEHKINPANSDIVLKALMDTLTKINITLFNEMGSLLQARNSQGTNNKSTNPIKFIPHEFYYWNIIVISQQIGKPSIASLVQQEAIHFSPSFRTQTALMIINSMLKEALSQNKLATCSTLLMRFKDVKDRAKNISLKSLLYTAMIQMAWIKTLLRLGLNDECINKLMDKFDAQAQSLFSENPQPVFSFEFYKQFIKAQIQYFKGNYKASLNLLGQVIRAIDEPNNKKLDTQSRQKIRHMAENNVAAVMLNMDKIYLSRHMILRNNEFFRKACNTSIDNEKYVNFQRSKELLIYTYLKSDQRKLKIDQYRSVYQSLNQIDSNRSYKLFYRKGQLSLNMFHKIIRDSQNLMPYKQIFDSSDCYYFYPNEPYFQSKGKNRNPLYNQGKKYYRRYQVSEWDCKGIQERKSQIEVEKNEENTVLQVKIADQSTQHQATKLEVPARNKESQTQKKKRKGSTIKEKEDHRKHSRDYEDSDNDNRSDTKFKEAPSSAKEANFNKPAAVSMRTQELSEVAFSAISYFKQSLSLLEEERRVIVSFSLEEKDISQLVNQKLDQDYRRFKQSILVNLCYLYLCRNSWAKVIEYSEQFKRFVAYERKSQKYANSNGNSNGNSDSHHQQLKKQQQQNEYYCVLTYQMQAYCQMNKFAKAYQSMQEIIQEGYSEAVGFEASSSVNQNPSECKIQPSNQYGNLLYNITVLHARDNHLPQAHQSLQKILSETNLLPNKQSMKTPLSVNDLLLHYHLRTSDRMSALQILKRRRVMGMGGVNGVYSTLKVTK